MNRLRLLIWMFCLLLSAVYADKRLVNGTATTVGEVVITVRDVELDKDLEAFRAGESRLPGKLSGQALRKHAQKTSLQAMVNLEMKSFRYSGTERMEAEKIVAQRKSEGKGALWTKLLQTYGRSEKEAITLLATTIGVKKFLDKKIETLTPEITDSETERYYRQNPGKYPGGDLESHRLQISADLKADRRQKALEDWVQSLKEKYKFANHLPDSIEPG